MTRAHQDLAELARLCASNAHITKARDAAGELWRMALEYQRRAAALDSGKLPDIGPPPAWFEG